MAWDLIPPEVRARLRTLRIGSRRAAGGRGFGLHRSRSRGAGMEFAQYRGYEPGDELRRIDWKLYARSDRFFVREAERESQLRIWVVLDTSASMGQADEARPDWSRLDAARALAACMFEVAVAQSDPFGLALAGNDGVSLLPTAVGMRQREAVVGVHWREAPRGPRERRVGTQRDGAGFDGGQRAAETARVSGDGLASETCLDVRFEKCRRVSGIEDSGDDRRPPEPTRDSHRSSSSSWARRRWARWRRTLAAETVISRVSAISA